MPSRHKLVLAWLCFGILALALGLSLFRWLGTSRALEKQVQADCRNQARRAAGEIQNRLKALEAVTHGLVRDLEQGRVKPRDLAPFLKEAMAGAPKSAWRLGVLFQPYAAGPESCLWGPYLEREGDALRPFAYEASADYTRLGWYQLDLGLAGWNEPHHDPSTGDLLVDYSEPFHLPGSSAPSGVVRVEVHLKVIQNLVGSLAPGSSGYGFLLSARGVYLADPLDAHVRKGETMESVGRAMRDQGRLAIARSAMAHQAGFAQSFSSLTGQHTWIFLEPVPAAGWSLGLMIIKDELPLSPSRENRILASIVALGSGLALAVLYLLAGVWKGGAARTWAFSLAGSLVVAAGTGFLWYFAYTLHQAPRDHELEVMSIPSREAFIQHNKSLGAGLKEVSSLFVRAGLFIQQIELSGDSQVKISGQVWERLPRDFPEDGRGIVFPEATACTIGYPLERRYGDELVQLYPFQGIFHMQADSVVNYPFDRSSVRIRIWPRVIYSNVVLVPDLEAYTILVPVSLPGMDKGIELSGWKLGQSHFSMLGESYNTNFGFSDYVGQQESPELAYSFTLRRNFTNPFIATFLPLLVVAGLLFALVAITVGSREQMVASGYNAMNLLRSVTTLFFPVVLAQINLRNHILTEGLLYVEYYYFVIYLLVLLSALNGLAVLYWDHPVIQDGDNRIAKVCFWPALTGCFFAISALYLW